MYIFSKVYELWFKFQEIKKYQYKILNSINTLLTPNYGLLIKDQKLP